MTRLMTSSWTCDWRVAGRSTIPPNRDHPRARRQAHWCRQAALPLAAQELHQITGPPFHFGATAYDVKAVSCTLASRPSLSALQNNFPLAVDRKIHGVARLKLHRVADMLGDRHLAFARDGGCHAVSPKYYHDGNCNTSAGALQERAVHLLLGAGSCGDHEDILRPSSAPSPTSTAADPKFHIRIMIVASNA